MNRKVILIILDGCRPDGIAQADTPHIDALRQVGAYTWAAQSVMPSISLPTHMSMFRGVPPERHGITENVYAPTAALYPSVVEVARQAGMHTAMFYDWEELRDLNPPAA
ncbi:MAG: alkaline phosphatase family protein [Anaerolineae bacterium]|nr:alkaline phosphatase family protein [Anaerolineae bacterium]